MGSGVILLHDCLWLSLPPAAIVHQMGLQVPLAPKPDSTCLAGEDVLWMDTERYKGDMISGYIQYFLIYV